MDAGAMAPLRGLGNARPIFSPRWVAGLAPVAEAGMAATIEVFSLAGEPVRNPVTDTWETPKVVHYSGKARVQPVRSTREVQNTGDPTMVQRVRFQVPLGVWTLRPNQQVKVTSSPLNPALEDDQFVVVEITDSSNPFERTFECTSNIETGAV